MDTVQVTHFQRVETTVSVMSSDELRGFAADVATRSATLFADLWKLGQQMVYKAYSSTDDLSEMFTEIVNGFHASPRVQDSLCHYLKRAGINASRPAPGSTQFIVGRVLDRGYQQQAFDYVRRIPPMPVERKVVAPKGAKTLKGTAAERAADAIAKLVARVKKDDPLGAAAIHEMMTEHSSCYFDKEGNKQYITDEETDAINTLLILMVDGRFAGFRTKEEVAA